MGPRPHFLPLFPLYDSNVLESRMVSAMLPRSFIAVLAIALGLPFLILLALVSSGSGVSPKALTSVLNILVLSSFVILMIFEIKRLVDQPTDGH